MYLIFFWVKREKTNKEKKNSVLGEGRGMEEADTYQSHDALLVYLPCRAVPPPSGLGAPSDARAGAGMRGGRIQVEGIQGFQTTKVA